MTLEQTTATADLSVSARLSSEIIDTCHIQYTQTKSLYFEFIIAWRDNNQSDVYEA